MPDVESVDSEDEKRCFDRPLVASMRACQGIGESGKTRKRAVAGSRPTGRQCSVCSGMVDSQVEWQGPALKGHRMSVLDGLLDRLADPSVSVVSASHLSSLKRLKQTSSIEDSWLSLCSA